MAADIIARLDISVLKTESCQTMDRIVYSGSTSNFPLLDWGSVTINLRSIRGDPIGWAYTNVITKNKDIAGLLIVAINPPDALRIVDAKLLNIIRFFNLDDFDLSYIPDLKLQMVYFKICQLYKSM